MSKIKPESNVSLSLYDMTPTPLQKKNVFCLRTIWLQRVLESELTKIFLRMRGAWHVLTVKGTKINVGSRFQQLKESRWYKLKIENSDCIDAHACKFMWYSYKILFYIYYYTCIWAYKHILLSPNFRAWEVALASDTNSRQVNPKRSVGVALGLWSWDWGELRWMIRPSKPWTVS